MQYGASLGYCNLYLDRMFCLPVTSSELVESDGVNLGYQKK